MKKIFKLLFVCIGLGMLASACSSSNNDDYVVKQTFPECFAYVEDYSSGASAYYKNVSYEITLNYTTALAEVTVYNLKLTDGTSLGSMRMTNLPWHIDNNGWIEIKADQVKPSTGLGGEVTVTGLKVRILQRIIGQSYMPAVSFRFAVNQHFTVTSSTMDQVTFGTTVSVKDGGTSFTTKNTYYQAVIDTETRQLKLTLYKAQFIDKMPAMDITINNIPYTIVSNRLKFEAASKTPTIGGVPYDGFPITDLVGEIEFGQAMTLNFDCRPQTMGGALFHVGAETGYPQVDANQE